jgi:cellulose 1,4-beta-cellobiosidase
MDNISSPLRRLRRGIVALVGAVALGTAVLVVATPGAALAAGCAVTYTVNSNWGSGFQSLLTITPGNAVTSWTVDFDVADQQVVLFAAYGTFTQTGSHVTLHNASFNGTVAAGASVNILVSVNTNPTYTNVPPAGFTVNGQTCSYTPPPYLVTSAHRVTVAEGGSTTVTARLSIAPPSNVTVTVGGGSTGSVITASPASMSFTPANWDVPQTVTLRSIEDADTTGQTGTFSLSQQNYIPGFPHVVDAFVFATQLDND